MNRARLLASIRRHEGERAVYQDSLGVWTSGIGHNLTNEPLSDYTFQCTTVGELLAALSSKEQFERWLAQDVEQAIADAKTFLGAYAFDLLDDVRQEVVIEMSFQLGLTRLSTFVNFRAALIAEDFDEAHNQMLDSRAARQTPRRWHELALIMQSGTNPH